MSRESPIYIATYGVGSGRPYYAHACAQHLVAHGHTNVSIVDVGDYHPLQRWLYKVIYKGLSPHPSIFRWSRQKLDYRRIPPVPSEKLRDRIPVGSTIISVSPNAMREVVNLCGVQVIHVLGDRIVQRSDAARNLRGVAIPNTNVENLYLLANHRRFSIGGMVHPPSIERANSKEQRYRLGPNGVPHILFSVNGAGGLGKTGRVVRELAPLVRSGRILLDIFVGTHGGDEMEAVYEAQQAHVPVAYGVLGRNTDGIRIWAAGNKNEALNIRAQVVGDADIAITPTANEFSHLPLPVITFRRAARNDAEQANARFGLRHGTLFFADDIPLHTVVENLGTVTHGVTRAQHMFDIAQWQNDAFAGRRLVEWINAL